VDLLNLLFCATGATVNVLTKEEDDVGEFSEDEWADALERAREVQ
jgi:hypothetical protein